MIKNNISSAKDNGKTKNAVLSQVLQPFYSMKRCCGGAKVRSSYNSSFQVVLV